MCIANVIAWSVTGAAHHHRAAAGSLPLSSHQSQLLSLTQRPSGNAQRGLSLARVCSCRIRTAALAPLHAFLHAPIHLK